MLAEHGNRQPVREPARTRTRSSHHRQHGSLSLCREQVVDQRTNPATSSISAFSIVDETTGKLQPITAGGSENPYVVGAGPTCMVEDPSLQYIFTSTTSTVR